MTVAKRELGRTGLQVTTLGCGAMELRGAPRARDITEAQAETILNKVLDSGINYIDTSIDYGLSEERIGRYISHRRAEYYLVLCFRNNRPMVSGCTVDFITPGVDDRLAVDVVDEGHQAVLEFVFGSDADMAQ
jgi:aryl-alcohol dehydrogenase-like predicted oxidoreductase